MEDAIPKIAIPRGTVIACPTCRKDLYTTTEDFLIHTRPRADHLKPLDGTPPMEANKTPLCPICKRGVIFDVLRGKMHTSEGWRP